MNSFVKASLIAAMMTAPLMADESFGGVGITIYQVREGVHVAEVIPGTPAAETNLRAGDIITSVDGVSLKGQDIEFSKSKLRGQVNKPLEITYTSNGETYSTVIRRAQITVKDLDNKAVKSWYGDKTSSRTMFLLLLLMSTEFMWKRQSLLRSSPRLLRFIRVMQASVSSTARLLHLRSSLRVAPL